MRARIAKALIGFVLWATRTHLTHDGGYELLKREWGVDIEEHFEPSYSDEQPGDVTPKSPKVRFIPDTVAVIKAKMRPLWVSRARAKDVASDLLKDYK